MERLEPLVGEWSVEGSFRDAGPTGVEGRSVYEWTLDRAFLVERSEVPHPEAPGSVSLIGRAPSGDGFLQHYFDSRGIARVYKMTFENGVWKRWRDEADFSPLSFGQRFEGRFSDDGRRIDARWEITDDDGNWMVDFELTYTRVGR
jgi:hypothetical protein